MSTAVIPEPVTDAPVVDPVAPVAETVLTPAADPVAPPAPVVPDTYDLTLPENAALDAASLERTAAFARERGLTNEAATAALHLANSEVAAALDARAQAETKLLESWRAETLADTSLGKTPQERTAAIQKGVQVIEKYTTAHPERAEAFKGVLNGTGIGNHPELVRFIAYLGEVASEGSLVTAQIGGDGKVSDAELFYGTSTK